MTDRLTFQYDIKTVSDVGAFEGYASTFNDVDKGDDVVLPGAFQKSLQSRSMSKVKMLWNHNTDKPIGKWTDGHEDEKGLFVKGQLFTQMKDGNDAYVLMKEGQIDSLSIGFRTKNYSINASGIRELKEIDLLEISPVTFPMNDKAVITNVKSLVSEIKTIRDFEAFLREAGYSRSEAKAIASRGFKPNETTRDEEELLAAMKKLTQALTG